MGTNSRGWASECLNVKNYYKWRLIPIWSGTKCFIAGTHNTASVACQPPSAVSDPRYLSSNFAFSFPIWKLSYTSKLLYPSNSVISIRSICRLCSVIAAIHVLPGHRNRAICSALCQEEEDIYLTQKHDTAIQNTSSNRARLPENMNVNNAGHP